MDQHTAGPWEIRIDMAGGSVIEPGIAEVLGLGKIPTANARLIAAAPDLLAALVNLADCAQLVIERWERGDLADAVRSLAVDLHNAQVALARARGQS